MKGSSRRGPRRRNKNAEELLRRSGGEIGARIELSRKKTRSLTTRPMENNYSSQQARLKKPSPQKESLILRIIILLVEDRNNLLIKIS